MPKVLVVEDDPDIRRLLEVRVAGMGHRVLAAASAEEAIEMLTVRGLPDILVLDVLLPRMSGLELLAQLRQQPAYAAMPAIFLSGRVQDADIAAGRKLDATYLTKPVVISALATAITRALEPSRSASGGW